MQKQRQTRMQRQRQTRLQARTQTRATMVTGRVRKRGRLKLGGSLRNDHQQCLLRIVPTPPAGFSGAATVALPAADSALETSSLHLSATRPSFPMPPTVCEAVPFLHNGHAPHFPLAGERIVSIAIAAEVERTTLTGVERAWRWTSLAELSRVVLFTSPFYELKLIIRVLFEQRHWHLVVCEYIELQKSIEFGSARLNVRLKPGRGAGSSPASIDPAANSHKPFF